MRILFAEDDRDLNNAVKALLERNGYMVDAVYDGEDAVDYALSGQYDGLLLDWMMPKLDGIQALSRIRAQGINLPCLMLTARDAVEDKVTGLDAGADDYLSKPFNASDLLARIRAMLRRRDVRRLFCCVYGLCSVGICGHRLGGVRCFFRRCGARCTTVLRHPADGAPSAYGLFFPRWFSNKITPFLGSPIVTSQVM